MPKYVLFSFLIPVLLALTGCSIFTAMPLYDLNYDEFVESEVEMSLTLPPELAGKHVAIMVPGEVARDPQDPDKGSDRTYGLWRSASNAEATGAPSSHITAFPLWTLVQHRGTHHWWQFVKIMVSRKGPPNPLTPVYSPMEAAGEIWLTEEDLSYRSVLLGEGNRAEASTAFADPGLVARVLESQHKGQQKTEPSYKVENGQAIPVDYLKPIPRNLIRIPFATDGLNVVLLGDIPEGVAARLVRRDGGE